MPFSVLRARLEKAQQVCFGGGQAEQVITPICCAGAFGTQRIGLGAMKQGCGLLQVAARPLKVSRKSCCGGGQAERAVRQFFCA